MAKQKELEQDINEHTEGQEQGQPSQGIEGGLDIKRLIMFAVIAWLAVAGAFIVVFRMSSPPEDGLEAAEQAEAFPDDALNLPDTGAADQPVDANAPDASSGSTLEGGALISEPIIVAFDNTITNISGTNGRRFLKAKVNLEVANTEVESKIRARMIQLRDRLLAILSSKAINELDGWEHQDIIRREVKDEFNVLLHTDGFAGIKKVYFTEFVIQ